MRGDIKEKQHEEVDLQAEANMELRAAEKHHDTWKNTHEPELRQVEKELDTLRAIEQIRRFEEQTTDIQEKLDQIDAAEEELRNLEHTLSTTPLPTKKELKTYQEKNLELATLKGQLEQAAIRIRFDLQARDAPITTDPDAEYLTEDEEYLVLGPTAFTIGGLGTIRVRGGGSSLEDLQAKEQSLSADVALLFKRFGVVREQELYDLQQRRQELDITIKRLKKTLNDLTSEKDSGQLNAEVNRIRQKITVKRAEISAISPELQDLSDDAIRERAEALDKEKKKLTRACCS
ncbi:MAG: hypothetical protein RQM90_00130 [Methanoculleus sp.]